MPNYVIPHLLHLEFVNTSRYHLSNSFFLTRYYLPLLHTVSLYTTKAYTSFAPGLHVFRDNPRSDVCFGEAVPRLRAE